MSRAKPQTTRPVFPHAFGPAFGEVLLHHGFSSGLAFEDAAEGIDVLAGDGLEDDPAAFLDEIDAGAGRDPKPPAKSRRDDQSSLRCDTG
jgi:hypothetical protein